MGILNKVQKEQKVWAKENFSETGISKQVDGYNELLELISKMGTLSRTHLKESQGIRGTNEEHQFKAIETINLLNFLLIDYKNSRFLKIGEHPYLNGTSSIFGVAEEVGELAQDHLKGDTQKIKDSIGDIVIYLADYCNRMELDLEEIVSDTWRHVKQRNWNKNPNNGKV